MLADHVDRRRLIIAVNAVMAAVVSTLLAVRSPGQVWLVFTVMAAYGASTVLIDPAESALFPSVASPGLRARINGMRLTLTEGGKLTAPLLGAALFTLLGGGAVAVLDGATFTAAALTTSRLRVDQRQPAARGSAPTRWHTQVLAGFTHLRSSPELRPVVAAAAAAMAISGLGAAAQYSLVDALGRPPAFLGVLSAVLGAGSVTAGLTSSQMINRLGEHRLALLGLVDFTAGALLDATGWLPTVVAGSLVLGFALSWSVLAAVNLSQQRTPTVLQGRVAAALTLLLFAPLPLTQAASAGLIQPLGYRGVYLLTAASLAITAAVFERSRTPSRPR